MTLIHSDGSLDEPAIQAEINRRIAEQEARVGWGNRDYHERHVLQSAAAERWPIIEAAIAAEWQPGERRAYLETLFAARWQSPDGDGNRRYEELSDKARAMLETVQSRAIIKFHRGK